jgi:hypothetical protein
VVIQRLRLIHELETWRYKASRTFEIFPHDAVGAWDASAYQTNRFGTVLNLQYYNTAMLINAAVLMSCLPNPTPSSAFDSGSCTAEAAIAIEHDFVTARSLCTLVRNIAQSCPDFIDQNAIWWMSNYSSKTPVLILSLGKVDEEQRSRQLYIYSAYS